MALVHVEDVRIRYALDRGVDPNRPDTADTGQQLLFDPVFLIAAVQPIGDVAQIVVVLRDVGIQEQQRNSAHLGNPHPGPQHPRLRQGELDEHRRAVVGPGQQSQRQTLRIQRGIVLVLPAVGCQRLTEVAGAVVQADADQGQAQIRSGLEMVAGQDAQTAGIDRQHFGDAELHGEVADTGGQHGVAAGLQLLVPERLGEVLIELARQSVEPLQEAVVLGEFVEPRGADLPEQCHRVASDARPLRGVDAREQLLGRDVPRPTQVGRQRRQRGDPVREVGSNGEPAKGLHA